jgi:hypothetical protein
LEWTLTWRKKLLIRTHIKVHWGLASISNVIWSLEGQTQNSTSLIPAVS